MAAKNGKQKKRKLNNTKLTFKPGECNNTVVFHSLHAEIAAGTDTLKVKIKGNDKLCDNEYIFQHFAVTKPLNNPTWGDSVNFS